MKQTIIKTGMALLAGLLLTTTTIAQPPCLPSLTDNLWVSSTTQIQGLNTAVIDIPIGGGFGQLAACAYLNSAGGGVSVLDAYSGTIVTLNYPVTVGGALMTSVPDVILGNIPGAFSTLVTGQDFTMAVAFLNDHKVNVSVPDPEIQIDYFDIHYVFLGTGGAFSVTYRNTEIISFPAYGVVGVPTSGYQLQGTPGTFKPYSTVHLDVVADPSTLRFGTPECDRFFAVYDAQFTADPAHGGTQENWIWASYGGNNVPGGFVGGLSLYRTCLQQHLGSTDPGMQPDVAGITYDSTYSPTVSTTVTTTYDMAWIAYTHRPGALSNDAVTVTDWFPQIASAVTPPSFYNTPPNTIELAPSSVKRFFHPRIDANDDHSTNGTFGTDNYKVVYEKTVGTSKIANSSDISTGILSSGWINLTSITAGGIAPATYNHHIPTVAYGVSGVSGTQYMVSEDTHVPSGWGDYYMMTPVLQGTPGSLALDPSSAPSYFLVNTNYGAVDMASCDYASAVSTPVNNIADTPVLAWGIYDPLGSGNYDIYYKHTQYDVASSTGYGYKTTGTTALPKPEDMLQVYPNPANDHITISNPGGVNADGYVVKNMLGQVVARGSVTTGKNNVAISSYAPGSYVVTLYKAGKECGNHIFVKN